MSSSASCAGERWLGGRGGRRAAYAASSLPSAAMASISSALGFARAPVTRAAAVRRRAAVARSHQRS